MTIPVAVVHETVLGDAIKTGDASLPARTLVEVPGARHFIMYNQPERCDAALDNLLRPKS